MISTRTMRTEVDHSAHSLSVYKGDSILVALVATLLLLGITAVVSSSFFISYQAAHWGGHFAIRQIIYIVCAIIVSMVSYFIPTRFWLNASPFILLVVIGLLVMVLVPGIGKTVNGSTRWLYLGFNLQVSEMAKLSLILYLASYVERKQYLIQQTIMGNVVPLLLMALLGGLIMLEPDFGGLFIILTIGLSMLFFAGMPWRYVLFMLVMAGVVLAVLIYIAPYRLARLTSFFDPWSNPFGEGYQLTQSLMAIGRGGLTGVGLGYGLQKQLYLPEAHTDFIYAVISEEAGFVGAACVGLLFVGLSMRLMYWVFKASRRHLSFEAMTIYGMMIWWSLSALLSMCVNLGLVPTKGIALPFISYGGSNLLVNACAVGILLRMTVTIHKEYE